MMAEHNSAFLTRMGSPKPVPQNEPPHDTRRCYHNDPHFEAVVSKVEVRTGFLLPDDPDNRVGLAESLMGQHRWNDALKLLAPLPPGEQLAICLFHLERYPEAAAVFSSKPASPSRDLWLGLCYQKMGQPQAAQSILSGSPDPRAKLLLQRL